MMNPSARSNHSRQAVRTLAFEPLSRLGVFGSGQIVAQLCNVGVQVLLLQALPLADYGRIGVAAVVATSAIFLLDLGYGQTFLRRPANDPSWMRDWSAALTQRALVACLTAATILFIWSASRPDDQEGWFYLLGAVPALLAGALNLPLVAISRGRSALAGVAVAAQGAGTFLGVLLVVQWPYAGAMSAFAFGGALSFGFILQATVCIFGLRDFGLLRPSADGWRRMELAREALAIWLLALVGTLYDRSVLFFIEAGDAALLPSIIVFVQLIGGLLNVMSQFQKLVLPVLAGESWDEDPTSRNDALLGVGLIAGGVAFATLASGLLLSLFVDFRAVLDHRVGLAVYAASWTPQCLLVGLGSLWFAKRRERLLLLLLVMAATGATAVSWAGLQWGSAMPALGAKAAASSLIWAATVAIFHVQGHVRASVSILFSILVSMALAYGVPVALAAFCYLAAGGLCLTAVVRLFARRSS